MKDGGHLRWDITMEQWGLGRGINGGLSSHLGSWDTGSQSSFVVLFACIGVAFIVSSCISSIILFFLSGLLSFGKCTSPEYLKIDAFLTWPNGLEETFDVRKFSLEYEHGKTGGVRGSEVILSVAAGSWTSDTVVVSAPIRRSLLARWRARFSAVVAGITWQWLKMSPGTRKRFNTWRKHVRTRGKARKWVLVLWNNWILVITVANGRNQFRMAVIWWKYVLWCENAR